MADLKPAALLAELHRANEKDRLEIVDRLREIAPAQAFPLLVQISDCDASLHVRLAARRLLEKIPTADTASARPSDDQPALTALGNPDPAIRLDAVLEIAGSKDRKHLDALLDRLIVEKDVQVIATLLAAIGRLGSAKEIPLLVGYVDHKDPRIRANVIEALWFLDTPTALPLIIPFLRDPDNRVRANAAMALRTLGPQQAFEVLSKMAGSNHLWMRCSAAYALRLFDAKLSEPILAKLAGDPNPRVRALADEAMKGAAGKEVASASPGESVPVEAASAAEPAGKDSPERPDAAVTGMAELRQVDAIIHAQDREGLGRLVGQMHRHGNRFLVSRIMSAIGLLGETRHASILVAHLADADPRVVSNAIQSLTRLGDASAYQDVSRLLASPHPRIRACAIIYLGRSPAVDVRQALAQMLTGDDIHTRIAGLFCLVELGRADLLDLLDSLKWEPQTRTDREVLLHRLLQLERRGFVLAGRVLERLSRLGPPDALPASHQDIPAGEPLATPAESPPDVSVRPLPDSASGGKVEQTATVAAARWNAYLLIARAVATATDIAVFSVGTLAIVAGLSTIGGGLPPGFLTAALAVALALVLLRDLPGGTGIGKRLVGLAVKASPGSPILARAIRQLPILVFPWGLWELAGATGNDSAQRQIDRRLGLEIVPEGVPRLGALAAVWLALFALGGTAGVLLQRPSDASSSGSSSFEEASSGGSVTMAVAPTRSSPTSATRPSARAPLAAVASAASTADAIPAAAVGGEPAPARGEHLHLGMALSIPIPQDWSIVAQGSNWVEMRPREGSSMPWGTILLMAPGEDSEKTDPASLVPQAYQYLKDSLAAQGRRLIGWTQTPETVMVAHRQGLIHRGAVMGDGEVQVLATDIAGQSLAIACALKASGGSEGVSSLLARIVAGLHTLAGGQQWRRYRSAFQPLILEVPQGWIVDREDARVIGLKPLDATQLGWIRLERLANIAQGKPQSPAKRLRQRIQATYAADWANRGFEMLGEPEVETIGSLKTVVLRVDLRCGTEIRARFRTLVVTKPVSLWIDEWFEQEAQHHLPGIDALVGAIRPLDGAGG